MDESLEILNVPFAARFPRTPETVTMSPLFSGCGAPVVITIGATFVAFVIARLTTPPGCPAAFATYRSTCPVAGFVTTTARVMGAVIGEMVPPFAASRIVYADRAKYTYAPPGPFGDSAWILARHRATSSAFDSASKPTKDAAFVTVTPTSDVTGWVMVPGALVLPVPMTSALHGTCCVLDGETVNAAVLLYVRNGETVLATWYVPGWKVAVPAVASPVTVSDPAA